jgi:hypothetical protein
MTPAQHCREVHDDPDNVVDVFADLPPDDMDGLRGDKKH